MLVMKEEIFRAVVGHIDVVPSVVVKVRGGYTHGAAHVGADPGPLADIGERAVAVVVEQKVGLAFVVKRPRVIGRRIESAIVGIEFDITADEKIDAAILVVVEPG